MNKKINRQFGLICFLWILFPIISTFGADDVYIAQANLPNTLTASDIRGWVYVYDNIRDQGNSNRRVLEQGEHVPIGKELLISANSRVTFTMGNAVQIGLNGNTHVRFDEATQNRSTIEIKVRLEQGSSWMKLNGSVLAPKSLLYHVNLIRTVLKQDTTLFFQSGEKTGSVDITYIEGNEDVSFWRTSNDRYFLKPGMFLPVSPDTTQPDITQSARIPILKQTILAWMNWKPEPLNFTLDYMIPPLEIYPPYGTIPALHPYQIPIDHTMLLPPETRSMGQIIAMYKKALEEYKKDTGQYPTKDQGLDVLTVANYTDGWDGPYVPLSLPKRDLWGSKFVYEIIQDKDKTYPDVRSMGPNQKDDKGLEDDIR